MCQNSIFFDKNNLTLGLEYALENNVQFLGLSFSVIIKIYKGEHKFFFKDD